MDSTYPLCVKEDSSGDTVIALDTITDFDDTVGNWDSVVGNFELGGTDTTSKNLKIIYFIFKHIL